MANSKENYKWDLGSRRVKNENITFHIFERMLLISTNFFEKASDYNLCPNTFIEQIFEFLLKLFNSYNWQRQNFSLQYQYNIKQTSNENKKNVH